MPIFGKFPGRKSALAALGSWADAGQEQGGQAKLLRVVGNEEGGFAGDGLFHNAQHGMQRLLIQALKWLVEQVEICLLYTSDAADE